MIVHVSLKRDIEMYWNNYCHEFEFKLKIYKTSHDKLRDSQDVKGCRLQLTMASAPATRAILVWSTAWLASGAFESSQTERLTVANTTTTWNYTQLGRLKVVEKAGSFDATTCIETCKLIEEFCRASDGKKAFLLLDAIPKGPYRTLGFTKLHFSAAWMSSVWKPEYLFENVIQRYSHEMKPRTASIIHGAMWQAVYGAAVEKGLGPGEMLNYGLKLCGANPSFEMMWTCSHGIGHAASYFAISQYRPIDKPACAEFPTGFSDISVMRVAERICAEYSDRGLAYSCAEGVWMTTAGSKLINAQEMAETTAVDGLDPSAGFEMCETAMFPAMCIYYVRKMRIEGAHGKAYCETPTIKDVCSRYDTNPFLYRQCAYGVACADGRAVTRSPKCDWTTRDLMARCEGFESEVLTSLCLDGLNYIHAVKLGERAEYRSGYFACEQECHLWKNSTDPKIRAMPCYTRLICQKKEIVKSPGFFIPAVVLDLPLHAPYRE